VASVNRAVNFKAMKKEYRAYWLPTDDLKEIGAKVDDIYFWNEKEKLPQKAKKFIAKAETLGLVATLRYFSHMLTQNETVYGLCFFITNKY
jgi:hypothetical protein